MTTDAGTKDVLARLAEIRNSAATTAGMQTIKTSRKSVAIAATLAAESCEREKGLTDR